MDMECASHACATGSMAAAFHLFNDSARSYRSRPFTTVLVELNSWIEPKVSEDCASAVISSSSMGMVADCHIQLGECLERIALKQWMIDRFCQTQCMVSGPKTSINMPTMCFCASDSSQNTTLISLIAHPACQS